MRIIITEEQLRILTETLGVPNNITETAQEIYNGMYKYLIGNKTEYIDSNFNFTLSGDFNIGSKKDDNGNLTPDFIFIDVMIFVNLEKGYYGSLALNNVSQNAKQGDPEDETLIMKEMDYSIEYNAIHFNFKSNYYCGTTYGSIANYIKKNWKIVNTKLSHELKHQYDRYKNPNIRIGKRADYFSKSDYSNPKLLSIPPMNEFIFFMYYTSYFENLVRNSELYTELKQNKITKNNFKEFMSTNGTIKQLIKIRDLSLDKIIMDIKTNYLKELDKFLNYVYPLWDLNTVQIDNKINEFLKLINIDIHNLKREYITNYIGEITAELMANHKKYLNKQFKFNNNERYLEFFYNEQKQMNKKAGDMLNKLYKMYDLLGESKINLLKMFPMSKFNIIGGREELL